MAETNQDMLRDAIARNLAAVLSLPSAGMLRHHKTRFLSEADSGFWMEGPPQERPLVDELIGLAAPVGVAFKARQISVVFATPIVDRQDDFAVNESARVGAVLLAYPESFRKLQRRAVYRVVLPMEHAAQVRVWRIPEHAVLRDKPMAAQEIPCWLRNLSVMGLGVRLFPREGQRGAIAPSERLRVFLKFRDWELLAEGRLIYQREAGGNLLAGAQFKKLEKDLEGRQALSRLNLIVGQIQRDEICRRRAG